MENKLEFLENKLEFFENKLEYLENKLEFSENKLEFKKRNFFAVEILQQSLFCAKVEDVKGLK
jgi:hypothetical protein